MTSIKEINSLALAYIGDAIYEIYVRKNLVDRGINKVNDLQKEAVNYVSAKNQAKYLKQMLESNFFNDEEISVIKRARNHKVSSSPRKTDINTYKWSTGLEALIGYLYLEKKKNRIDEIMYYILEG